MTVAVAWDVKQQNKQKKIMLILMPSVVKKLDMLWRNSLKYNICQSAI